MNAVHVTELWKRYKKVEALRGIDLAIPKGEFFGLLGPNGAGKTTLIKTLVGLCRPTAGSIAIFGHGIGEDPVRCKSFVGLSPQEPNVDRYFTLRKILEFHGGYYGMRRKERKHRAMELLEQFGLGDKRDDEYWRLSGGMQKRSMIARSLMTSPKILILDEPTAGVDVEQRHQLWERLRNLNRDGTTILLTTHYIDEAEELCERVAIIDEGKIVEMGAPRELIRKHCEQFIEVKGKRLDRLTADCQGIAPADIVVQRGSLEQVFIKLTGHSINENS